MRIGAIVVGLLVLGCAERPVVIPGDECELNTNCKEPLICRLGRCRTECRAQRDCPAGLDCVRDELGLGACQLESETECTLASDCPTHLVCRFQRCVNACEDDRDCAPGAVCAEDDTGERGCRDFSTMECLYNTDCPEGLVCANDYRCRPECREDRDCRDNDVCRAGVCGPPMDGGLPDGGGPDAGMDAMVTGALLDMGYETSCAVASGELRCWGANDTRQVGDGPVGAASYSTPYTHGLAEVHAISVGIDHACAASGSELRCWGDNSEGQVGAGLDLSYPAPALVTGLPAAPIDAVAAGRRHTCAIVRPNRLFCWGRNTEGQLGDGTGAAHTTPTEITTLAGAPVALGTYADATCVVLMGGQIECFGDNGSGQLGHDDPELRSLSPVTVVGVNDAIGVGVGSVHACALRASGEVLCWGSNFLGQWGDGTPASPLPPDRHRAEPTMPVLLPGPARALSVGSTHACARLADRVYCWGDNQNGQCGQDPAITMAIAASPVQVAGLGTIEELGAGGKHTCVRVSGVTHLCFGDNSVGQLGRIGGDSFTPVAVSWL